MSKVTSDGSTASYYELPEGAKELQHLISFRNMNGQLAEIFRACYRYGIVSHSDQLRDAKKMVFYAMAEVERLEKWSKVGGFERHEATPNVLEFDEARADAIGQNGNGGEHYQEVHGNSHVPTEDMTDPRNWRAGDWVEFIYGSGNFYTHGRLYRLSESSSEEYDFDIMDDNFNGEHRWDADRLSRFFRFHARPDADGWIKWDGGECPVGDSVNVDIMYGDGAKTLGKASGYRWYWLFGGAGGDIVAYRPPPCHKAEQGLDCPHAQAD